MKITIKQKAIVVVCLISTFLFSGTFYVFAVPQQPSSPQSNTPREDPLGDNAPASGPISPQRELTLEEKQELARKVLKEIDQLAIETEMLIENYNEAQEGLKELEAQLAEAQQKFDEINQRYLWRQNIFGERVTEIYKSGRLNFIDVLLATESFSDFISRIRFLSLIADRDSSLVDSILQERSLLRTVRDELQDLKQQKLDKVQQLQSKRAEIEEKLRVSEQYLWKVEKDIQELINEEILEKARLQSELFEKLRQEAAIPGSPLAAMLDPTSPVYTALKYLGLPYLWGGEKPETGFDCSGLTLYVFRQHGVVLPHYSGWQYKMGEPVEKEELQPGDLIFFGKPIHHVGMYIGGNYMIHAPQTGDVIKISDFTTRKDYTGARRFPLRPRE